MGRSTRRIALCISGAGLVLLAGCTGDAEPAASADSTAASPTSTDSAVGATVIQPGKPGEPAETLSADASVPEQAHNDADVMFVRMMIAHHAQAVRMGELARTRAHDEQVRSVATRIGDTQGAEILQLASWLDRRGLEVPTAEQLEHGDHQRADDVPMMPGMLSEAQMDLLAAAEGHRFDVRYLRGMIAHHRGAVDMAESVMDSGADSRVSEIATDIVAGQRAEISRMREMLRGL